MVRAGSIQSIVRHGLCVSRGACVSAAPEGSMRLVLDEPKGMFVPEILDRTVVSGAGTEYGVCPGQRAPIVRLEKELFGDADHYRMELGWYRGIAACHSSNARILEHASSGGVMTDIARFLLERGIVDGVTVSRFVYGQPGPRTVSFVAQDLDGLLAGQGSKYCPTTTNELVAACVKSTKRYLFLGTPCQVLALRLAMAQKPELRNTFPLTMANFCGGCGLLADFAGGDAWLDRFEKKGGYPWSIVMLRNKAAYDVFRQIVDEGRLVVEPISEQEVLYSQRHNLDSKITRPHRRLALHRLFGTAMPAWDMPLPRGGGTWLAEIRTVRGRHKRALLYRLRCHLGLRRPHRTPS